MQHGLTAREAEIIRQLLAEHGITTYEIIGATSEGRDLPGSTYDGEIESLSGTVVTTTKAYDFWLDWFDGRYTLGKQREYWREVNLEETQDRNEILEAQKRLREKGASTP